MNEQQFCIHKISSDALGSLNNDSLTDLLKTAFDKANGRRLVFIIPSLPGTSYLLQKLCAAVQSKDNGKYERQNEIVNRFSSIHMDFVNEHLPDDIEMIDSIYNGMKGVVRGIKNFCPLASPAKEKYFLTGTYNASFSSSVIGKVMKPIVESYAIDPLKLVANISEINPQIEIGKSIHKTQNHFHFMDSRRTVSVVPGYMSYLTIPDESKKYNDDGDLVATIITLALTRAGHRVNLTHWDEITRIRHSSNEVKVLDYLDYSKSNKAPIPFKCAELLFSNNFKQFPKVSIRSCTNLEEQGIVLV
jgi:hypothetical protein